MNSHKTDRTHTTYSAATLFVAALFSSSAHAQSLYPGWGLNAAQDTDGDLIDDSLEEVVIQMWRPSYKYDAQESFWPASLGWTIATGHFENENNNNVRTDAEIAANPLLVLSVPGQSLSHTNDIWSQPFFPGYRIDITDGSRDGQVTPSSVSLMRTHGIFAHVVRLPDGTFNYSGRPTYSFTGDGSPALMIQYWQFFPFHDYALPLNAGDREGDWEYVDVVVRESNPTELLGMTFHHYGDDNCSPEILTPTDPEWPIHANGPVCYPEEDTHDWYHIDYAGDNFASCNNFIDFDGNGLAYRVENVINMGERYQPVTLATDTPYISMERQLAILWAGRWGDYAGEHVAGTPSNNPYGPAQRAPDVFPQQGSLDRLAAYVKPDGSMIYSNSGYNSFGCEANPYYPSYVGYGMRPGGNIRLIDDLGGPVATYTGAIGPSGTLRITDPVRIEPWGSSTSLRRITASN